MWSSEPENLAPAPTDRTIAQSMEDPVTVAVKSQSFRQSSTKLTNVLALLLAIRPVG
jgi:hypothetical protein